jgi:hypothetical protein
MHKNFVKNCLILFIATLLSACSTASFNDLFSNYNQQMRDVKQAQQQGRFEEAVKLIPSRNLNNGSYGLSMLEKARLEYLANNHVQSQKDFAQVYRLIQTDQNAAKIELSRGIENIAAIISNDNSTRYDIPLYEQSMLNSYQAMNYLAQQDLSGALVEIRRANLVQQQALNEQKSSIDQLQEAIAKQSVNIDSLSNKYPSMKEAIGQVKNGFQNAYTFYLSAVLYEAAGQSNSAYIDYKKAFEIYPENHFVQQDIWRLANSLNMTQDITLFKHSFEKKITDKHYGKNNGHVVIVVENGIVPAKQEIAIKLPIYTSHNDMRFYSVALPSYQNSLTNYSPLTLSYQNESYQSEEIVRLQSLAAKQLKDDLPMIATRQIARLITKEEVRQNLARNNGDIGNIFANIYNMATEKADTRSWSSLPDSIHILRLTLPAMDHKLMLNINGKYQPVNVTINPNKITLVKLTSIGAYHQYQTYNL